MTKGIRDIIATALIDLTDNFPNLVQAVAREKYFITNVQYRTEENALKNITIIDFEKEMLYEPQPFYVHTRNLFNLFDYYFSLE